MIDWNKYNPGQKIELKIVENEKTYIIKTILDEYEWAPNRTPLLAIITVLETSKDGKWNLGDKIKLPIITDDNLEHQILVCNTALDNSWREIARKALISLN
jgi:hypothetical protein